MSAQLVCHMLRATTRIAALYLSAAWCQFAAAQTIGPAIQEPDDVAGRRVIPEYAPIGYDLHGFDVLPSVTFGAKSDNNIFTRSSLERSDISFVAEPRLRIKRKGRQSNIAAEASARATNYARFNDQDSTEYRFEGTYTLGTGDANFVSTNLGYRREAVLRGTAEYDLPAGEPLIRRVLHGSVTGHIRLNRLSLDAQILAARQSYEDVRIAGQARLSQDFRNVKRHGLHALASYEMSGRTSFFTNLEYDQFNYNSSPLIEDRDANSWSATAGVKYELNRIFYAQLGIGYRQYDFREPTLGAIKGIAVSGHLRYFPSRLLAIRALVEQSNTTSPYDFVGAVTLTTARIETEYEMRRSLSWLGAVKFTLEDYAKQPYSARRIEATGGPRLRFNRWLSADATLGFARRFVNGVAPFEPYSQFYGMISVTVSR
ncbi:outer membrane beta-barrel protein [Novosphingobium guangzhouense]|uniref:Outer membrane beta-barrel protein n=1 Tax=Novosphingobium guangzhouense TaxID=1850347 RepID=A0A2K2G3H7_9SPHN|nr:outer membrane beta-barrel protein [Novosphingobium guangzhouense]PNU05599.1 hypothetical protein A8V01_15680 [Novosphingobium guangzhouense]